MTHWLEVETKVCLNKEEIPELRKRILKIAKFEKEGTKGILFMSTPGLTKIKSADSKSLFSCLP